MHRTSAPTSRRSRNPRHSTADSEHPFPPISTNRPIRHSGWRTENRLKNKPENSSWSLQELESRWTSRTLVRPIPDSTLSSWPTRRARTRRRSLSTSTNTFINPQTPKQTFSIIFIFASTFFYNTLRTKTTKEKKEENISDFVIIVGVVTTAALLLLFVHRYCYLLLKVKDKEKKIYKLC